MPSGRGHLVLNLEENLFRLPVSGRLVGVRVLGGREDLLLAEHPADDTLLAMRLAEDLARDLQGEPLDWRGMVVTDLDALMVYLRQRLIGDRVRADVQCMAPNCGQRIDVDFALSQFMRHHQPSASVRPGRGWSVQPGLESGWFLLTATGVPGSVDSRAIHFRLPTAGDQLAVSGRPDAEVELARRCLQPPNAPARLRHKAETAMDAMAPCLAGEIQAVCPACGNGMILFFEARKYCLQELRDRAISIYAEVDVLARRYHWSENEILDLPRDRRIKYVELAR